MTPHLPRKCFCKKALEEISCVISKLKSTLCLMQHQHSFSLDFHDPNFEPTFVQVSQSYRVLCDFWILPDKTINNGDIFETLQLNLQHWDLLKSCPNFAGYHY